MLKSKKNYANLIEVPMKRIIETFLAFGYQFDGELADLYNYQSLPCVTGNKIRRNIRYVSPKCFTKDVVDNTIIIADIGGIMRSGEIELSCSFSLGHPLFSRLLAALQRTNEKKIVSIISPMHIYPKICVEYFLRQDTEEEVLIKTDRLNSAIDAYISMTVEAQISIELLFREIDEIRKRNLNNVRRIQAKEIASLLLQSKFAEAELVLGLVKTYYLEIAKFVFDERSGKTFDEYYQDCFSKSDADFDNLPNNYYIDGEFIEKALRICEEQKLP